MSQETDTKVSNKIITQNKTNEINIYTRKEKQYELLMKRGFSAIKCIVHKLSKLLIHTKIIVFNKRDCLDILFCTLFNIHID